MIPWTNIFLYDFPQLATAGPVVKSTTSPTALSKEVAGMAAVAVVVLPNVCLPSTYYRPGGLIDRSYALERRRSR